MAPWILALADDLTGALEVGARFAGAGVRARVTTSAAVPPVAQDPVLVIDTETRHLSAAAAAQVVREIAAAALPQAPALIYKKTDSTLRGNIAAECSALLEVFQGRSLVYAPAYPEMGRTVRGGRLYVDGVPVHETAFAWDPLNPVRESEVAAVLGGLPAEILDGETLADVEAAAHAIAGATPRPVTAGPAGLAAALAACLDLPRTPRAPWPSLGTCLLVNGSLHPASAAQVEYARAHGWRSVRPGCAAGALAKGGCYLLDAAADIQGQGVARAAALAALVRPILEQSAAATLIVFGGDTAVAIHRALGAPDFEPLGEVVSGVPLCRCGGRTWITKAGGFGLRPIVCDIQRLLS